MRSDTTRIINDNSTSIVISRNAYAISGGKRTATTSTLAAQVVRLYGKNVTDVIRTGDDARFIRRREVRMLCQHNADVIAHSNLNEDTFGDYRIKDVRDIKWEGTIVSRQCTLEELN